MILIVGASGKLGQVVARRALAAGKAVRALSRRPKERLAALKAQGFEWLTGRNAKVLHVPRPVLAVMSRLLWPLHPGLSQVMAFALHDDIHDTTFDATALLQRYPLTLTRLDEWIREHCAPSSVGSASAQAILS